MGTLIKLKDLESALQEELSEMGSGFGTLLKFDATTSKYIIDNDEVAVGREYIAHVDQYARGFVKFVDKRPVDVRIAKLGEGIPPKRDDLDDLDLADTEDDPWVFQRYMPLEDTKTGEVVVFVGKSVGAKIALERLLRTFASGHYRGHPIIRLGIGSFPTKDYGPKPRPDFEICGWTNTVGAPINHLTADKAVRELPNNDSMKDDKTDRPPERDPDDPGFDEEDFNSR
jgi:hypothetical protein